MKQGQRGFAPVLNLTVYAKQVSGEMELIFHPSRTTGVEVFQKLKMDVLGKHIKDALDKYGLEAWGMTPVDERNDVRDMVQAAQSFETSWGHLANKSNDGTEE